ncbi:MAG: hypothetical protein ACYS8K_10610, partial [Planctomycetota bacterium]
MDLMRWFRRHRTALLAAVVVLLMISWGIGPVLQRALRESETSFGQIRGEPVGAADMQEAGMILSLYLRLGFGNPQAIWRLRFAGIGPRAMGMFIALARDFAAIVFEESPAVDPDSAWRFLVLRREAEAAGVEVTADETRELLTLSPVLADETGFSQDRYLSFLRTYGVSDSAVNRAGIELARVAKLVSLRREAFRPSTADAWMSYLHRGERIRLRFVGIDAWLFEALVEVSGEELRAFYDERKEVISDPESGQAGYMAPARVRVEYAVAATTEIMEQVQVAEDEIASYYDNNKIEFLEARPTGGDEAEQRAETEEGEPVSDEPPEGFRYQELAEVRNAIHEKLVRQKAYEQARKLVRKVREELDAVSSEYADEPLPLAQMARRYGLVYRVASTAAGSELLSREELAGALAHGA